MYYLDNHGNLMSLFLYENAYLTEKDVDFVLKDTRDIVSGYRVHIREHSKIMPFEMREARDSIKNYCSKYKDLQSMYASIILVGGNVNITDTLAITIEERDKIGGVITPYIDFELTKLGDGYIQALVERGFYLENDNTATDGKVQVCVKSYPKGGSTTISFQKGSTGCDIIWTPNGASFVAISFRTKTGTLVAQNSFTTALYSMYELVHIVLDLLNNFDSESNLKDNSTTIITEALITVDGMLVVKETTITNSLKLISRYRLYSENEECYEDYKRLGILVGDKFFNHLNLEV